jgi:hypothetical protein
MKFYTQFKTKSKFKNVSDWKETIESYSNANKNEQIIKNKFLFRLKSRWVILRLIF